MVELIHLSWIMALLAVIVLLFVPVNMKAYTAAIGVVGNAIATSWLAILVLGGQAISFTFYGGSIMGDVIIRIDELSAWFILIINFVFLIAHFYYANQHRII